MRKADRVTDVPTHILLVEDNPGDARILRELLAEGRGDRFTLAHVDRLDTGIRCLSQSTVDVILLDLSLPDSQGAETLARMHAAAKGVPLSVRMASGTPNSRITVSKIGWTTTPPVPLLKPWQRKK